MKRYFTLMMVVFFLSSLGAHGAVIKKEKRRVLNLCDLVDNWKKYHGRKVRVRAIYKLGAGASLYDPTCRSGEPLTYISLPSHTKGATKRLDRIAAEDRRAWVILDGVFYGPMPFDNIDPRLPAKVREWLENHTSGTVTWMRTTQWSK